MANLSDDERAKAREQFDKIDTDRDGFITFAELREYSVNHPDSQIFGLVYRDSNKDMKITFEEYCAGEKSSSDTDDEVWHGEVNDPSLAHQVRPGFRGSQTGYNTEGWDTEKGSGNRR